MRIGFGVDVHAFGPGDFVMLGGIRVPYTRGVLAHSDGDVVLHALCDALLGAGGLGDIGQHLRTPIRSGRAPTASDSSAPCWKCCARVSCGWATRT